MESSEFVYIGFWKRLLATLIDTLLMLAIILPVVTLIYGTAYWTEGGGTAGAMDALLQWVFPIIATVLFWIYKQATPGKMVIKAKIIDIETGLKPSNGRLIGRYFAYFISSLPLLLGFFWVIFDKRKQGWHDKLSRTAVVRKV